MSNCRFSDNPMLTKKIIENHKKAAEKYYTEHPDSLIPIFEQELRDLGFHFEIDIQIKQFLPKSKKIILPIAIKYYQQATYDNEKNFFLELFSFKGFDEVIPMLINDYYNPETPDLTRWFISDCLYTIRSKQYIDDYLNIISNASYGINRQMIVLLIGKLKVDKAIPILIELLEDRDVRLHSIIALGDLKKEELRPYFEHFQKSDVTVLRKYAKAALKKLDHNLN